MNPPKVNEFHRDPYRAVVIVLLGAAVLGTVCAVAGGIEFGNPVLLAVAVMLGLSGGVLTGVAAAQTMRANPLPAGPSLEASPVLDSVDSVTAEPVISEDAVPAALTGAANWLQSQLMAVRQRFSQSIRYGDILRTIRTLTAAAGILAIVFLVLLGISGYPTDPLKAGMAAATCLFGAGMAATAIRYLAGTEAARFPEGLGLRRGARIVAWMLVLAAISMGASWADRQAVPRILFFVVLAADAALCFTLFRTRSLVIPGVPIFPLEMGVLSVLGNRANIFASILDSAEHQLGIDLRSTWALLVIRRGLEPLVLGLCVLGWLSTSLTVVGVEEQGLVERLGVPIGGQPLLAGLHAHLPWPIDKVFRIPVRRVQLLEVGHEGTEAPGPEDVLWAVEHAPNEFTLLLGNGRDLITVDAGVQFRIVDAAAWRYHCQNPAQALSAIAYRAVMRNTVNLTLSEALSQNVTLLTERMRAMIQREANALGVGVEIMGFTVGGMHPPVAVAKDYQAVVSSELRKVTTVVDAQVYRARTRPESMAAALTGTNTAHAEGAEALARAAGEAWSFRTLQAQYRAAPDQFYFRRRLETLEKGLVNRDFTIVDSRFQRDGGELWVIP